MRLLIGLTLLIATLALTGCARTASASYLMTIEVDDNGNIYSGSGVWKQTYEGNSLRGRRDVIAVEIGTKVPLFVLNNARKNAPDRVFYRVQTYQRFASILRANAYELEAT